VTLSMRYHEQREGVDRPAPRDEETRSLLVRYVQAWERADVEGIVALLKEDAAYPMPPSPSWYLGRAAIRAFVSSTILANGSAGHWKFRRGPYANGRPTIGWYLRVDGADAYQGFALQVLAWEGDLLAEVITFVNPALLPLFGLPPTLS